MAGSDCGLEPSLPERASTQKPHRHQRRRGDTHGSNGHNGQAGLKTQHAPSCVSVRHEQREILG